MLSFGIIVARKRGEIIMRQDQLDKIVYDAIEFVNSSDHSTENMLSRLEEASGGKKTIDNESLTAFLLAESRQYTNDLIRETLSAIFVDNPEIFEK